MAIPTNGQGGIFASINITPLTDIFLVLLIIFMVATAVTIESAAHVDLPKLEASQPSTARGVMVTYTAEHLIFVNQKPVTEAQLGPAISAALADTTDKTVVFNGDPRVILGDAVRIVDIAKRSGAGGISLAVAPSSEEAGAAAPAMSEPPGEGLEPAPEPVAPSAP